MILGIDDPLKGDEANAQFAFVKFKKYFQRIFYKTGSEYSDWINLLRVSRRDDRHEIYIVGHSLGSTDHEVLKKFFDVIYGITVRITVFYHDEASKINAIERIIEMIGKENLIARVHGSDWTIRFVDQYDDKNGILKRPEEIEHKITFEP